MAENPSHFLPLWASRLSFPVAALLPLHTLESNVCILLFLASFYSWHSLSIFAHLTSANQFFQTRSAQASPPPPNLTSAALRSDRLKLCSGLCWLLSDRKCMYWTGRSNKRKTFSHVIEMSACRTSGTVGPRGHNYTLCSQFWWSSLSSDSLWVGDSHPETWEYPDSPRLAAYTLGNLSGRVASLSWVNFQRVFPHCIGSRVTELD